MTDLYVLMQLPNAGDDLQAIKKGVMEVADLVVINKVDLDPAAAARARGQIRAAMHDASPRGRGSDRPAAEVLELSALRGTGIEAFWLAANEFRDRQLQSGALQRRRREQDLAWLWERIEAGLRERFKLRPAVQSALPETTAAVLAGTLAASVAARRLLDLLD